MSRRLLVRTVLRLTATSSAVALTVVLAREPASGAFGDGTDDTGNEVTAAAVFCSGAGTATQNSTTTVVDTWIEEASPTASNGGNRSLHVRSSSAGDIRTLLRCTLPTIPAGCTVTAATVRLYAAATTSGRTLDLYRVDPAAATWNEYTVTWGTQPPTTGAPVATTAGAAGSWHQWTATALVQAQYASGNDGLLLRDRAEGNVSQVENRFRAREDGVPPQLVVTWG